MIHNSIGAFKPCLLWENDREPLLMKNNSEKYQSTKISHKE